MSSHAIVVLFYLWISESEIKAHVWSKIHNVQLKAFVYIESNRKFHIYL